MTLKQEFFSSKKTDVNDFFIKKQKSKKSKKTNFFTELLEKKLVNHDKDTTGVI
ncbi:hypothetical protein IMY97_22915 [Pectobacterium versatile]|uniref:hypothetical protein n=1 Tax=Pectobacterium TaxID=122277 RepID=UPI001304F099|nr:MULTISPECIES: hypothetical protein [Pectobacterium]MBA0189005.1 hypothetical protein [Pectobacterium odoriferum]MBK4826342.1 hypothetical protein [Pectobacterium carotovorum subsp. carotovorum]MBQ4788087.1 hypothetical protein [Pectobacterium versatile]UNE77619.1 hypothetical protein IMY97_22915 [Pectobacterium versatile]